jgi:hypothetical protein
MHYSQPKLLHTTDVLRVKEPQAQLQQALSVGADAGAGVLPSCEFEKWVGKFSRVNTHTKGESGIRAAKAASVVQFMSEIQEGSLLAVAGASEKYWLCRATKGAQQAAGAFISAGNSIARRQWFAEIQFFVFTKVAEGNQRQHRLEEEVVCVPCSAFVYERGLEFSRTEDGFFYLSADMHEQICGNDELQFDSDDEAKQEEEQEEEQGEHKEEEEVAEGAGGE